MKRIRDFVSPVKGKTLKRANSQKTPSKRQQDSDTQPGTSRTTLSRRRSAEKEIAARSTSEHPTGRSRTETSNAKSKQTDEVAMEYETFRQFLVRSMTDEEGKKAYTEIMKLLISENTQNIASLITVVKKQQEKIDTLESEVEFLKQHTRRKSLIVSGLKCENDESPEQSVMRLCKDN